MRTTSTLVLAILSSVCVAQTLFEEDFESAPQFTLNTADVNSVNGVANTWVVNNVYAGGDGIASCSGFDIPFTIGATNSQPAGITSQNGNYLHTAALVAISNGINCCSFGAADGFCTNPDDIFARMSTDVNTAGASLVEFSFWWLCNGGNQNYGEVYYSIDGGGSWVQITTPITQYRNVTSWSQQVISLPVFANQNTLRFGFRFHNGVTFSASDPGFAIDDVAIVSASPANEIVCTAAAGPYCAGADIDVPYALVGPFDPVNVFIAQLSDANGSFASPTTIGTVINYLDGSVPCTIPANTPVGSGYRIRVNSTSPAVTGDDNGVDITIQGAPNAGIDNNIVVCSTGTPFSMLASLLGAPEAGGSWTDPVNIPHPGTFNPSVDMPGCYTYTVEAVGCPSATAQLCITVNTAPDAGLDSSIVICTNGAPYDLFDALGGTPSPGGSWLAGGGPFSGIYIPGVTQGDVFIYVVQGQAPCTNSTANVTVTLDPCMGIVETTRSASPIVWLGQAGSDHRFAMNIPATSVQVFDARGAHVHASPVIAAKGLITMQAATLSSGMYTAVFISVDGLRQAARFVHSER